MPGTVPDTRAPLFIDGSGLDRADRQIRDPQWLRRQREDPDTRFLLVWHDAVALDPGGDLYLPGAAGRPRGLAEAPPFLGLDGTGALFAVDLSHLERPLAREAAGGRSLAGLRQAMVRMPRRQAAIAGYGGMLLRWHRHNRFCGRCGSPSEILDGGRARRCRSPGCGRELFPRIDPAVIMLVEQAAGNDRPARCLLAHHRRMPPGRYSTLAGFVETGESLEEAVRREVMEEVGIRVGAVDYRGSQPWPFPSSLMLGFRARAESRGIRVDGLEIDRARWFSAGQLRAAAEWDAGGDPSLPGRWSIARHLIDDWLAEQP